MSRKDARDFGAELSEQQPPEPVEFVAAAGRYGSAMAERVLLALLRQEVERLARPANAELLRRFFAHFYAPLVSKDELESYAQSFAHSPPVTVLGYPRTATQFPCFAVVLEREQETQEPLGQYLGQTAPGEPADEAAEFVGTMFEQTFGVYAYAEHPDQALYCYHLAKAVLIGATDVMVQLGLIDPHFSGEELLPQPELVSSNMFVRKLTVVTKALFTVPSFLSPDPARVRVAGIFAHDVVVSGVRGGVRVEGEDGC